MVKFRLFQDRFFYYENYVRKIFEDNERHFQELMSEYEAYKNEFLETKKYRDLPPLISKEALEKKEKEEEEQRQKKIKWEQRKEEAESVCILYSGCQEPYTAAGLVRFSEYLFRAGLPKRFQGGRLLTQK